MSIMPFGMRGNGEFERKEEIILNEIRIRGRATINVTLHLCKLHALLISLVFLVFVVIFVELLTTFCLRSSSPPLQ